MYSLILVDYNSIECAVAYIRQYAQCIKAEGPSHVVLVDNGTRTDSLDYLCAQMGSCQQLPQTIAERPLYRISCENVDLIYCHSGGNIGYAQGNNLGAKIADTVFADPFYVISNNDLILPEELDLQQVTRMFEADPAMALLGPKIVGTDGIPQTPRKRQSAFKKLIAWYWGVGPLRKYVDDIVYDAAAGPSEWVSGCFFFLRADAFAAVDGFDPNTFLYAEEMILSARLREKGFTTIYNPFLTVVHDHRDAYKTVKSALKTIRISHDSNTYYYKTYRGTSPALLLLSKCSFALYRFLYPLWQLSKKKKT